MKIILITSALFFVSYITNAQELTGKWSLEKLLFFGNTIYLDDSDKDKEKVLNSWIKMNEAEKDPELKKEITKSKDLIYGIAKKIFKSDIEFKDIKYEIYLEWTTGNLVYYDQKNETEIEKKEVDIKIWHDKDLKYKTITFPLFGDFHQSEKLKITLKENKLILEDIQNPLEGEIKTEAFIFYYKRKSENANSKDFEKSIKSPAVTEEEMSSAWDEFERAFIADEEKKIVFRENFSNNQNKWFEEESDRFRFKIIDDKYNNHYRIQSKNGGFWFSSIPIQFSTSDDFEISATFSKVSGTDDYYFGMMLGRNNKTGSHHFAGITGSGNCVFANKGPAPKDLISRTANENIKKGNTMNRIVIQKAGNFFQLFINDSWMGQTSVEKFFGNDFGFQLWSGDQSLTIDVYQLRIKVTKAEK